jgi:hypothetical protein
MTGVEEKLACDAHRILQVEAGQLVPSSGSKMGAHFGRHSALQAGVLVVVPSMMWMSLLSWPWSLQLTVSPLLTFE